VAARCHQTLHARQPDDQQHRQNAFPAVDTKRRAASEQDLQRPMEHTSYNCTSSVLESLEDRHSGTLRLLALRSIIKGGSEGDEMVDAANCRYLLRETVNPDIYPERSTFSHPPTVLAGPYS
jgi:hypothetical protein